MRSPCILSECVNQGVGQGTLSVDGKATGPESALEPFLARASGQGAPVARIVEREIRDDLECSVLA